MVNGFSPDALACSGAWAGNDSNQQAELLAQLEIDFAGFLDPTTTTYTILGKSDDANSGPFTANPESPTGTLTFDTAQTGFFAITLKASDSFSTYLFDGGVGGVTSIDFSTAGTAVNPNGMPQDLSHATYAFIGVTTPVPEPETYALMLAGLGAVSFMAKRRRKVA
jgi:hypothetical protein